MQYLSIFIFSITPVIVGLAALTIACQHRSECEKCFCKYFK